jgi:hypothetical protein
MEFLFFTRGDVQHYGENSPVILWQFNTLCFGMAVLAILPYILMMFVFIVNRNEKMATITSALMVAGILLWAICEDLTAHIFYGVDPMGDWNDFGFGSWLQYGTEQWIPNWYIIAALMVIATVIVTAFVVAKNKMKGRR